MTNATPLEHRRAEILRLGQEAVARRGARRRARRHAVLMVALTAGATVLAVTLAPTRIGPGAPSLGPRGSERAVLASGITVDRVATTAGLAASLAAAPGSVGIERIASSTPRVARIKPQNPPTSGPKIVRVGDSEVLALLREAGRPAGLIRVRGRVTLVYHEPEREGGPSSRAAPLASRVLASLPGRSRRP